MQEFLPYGHQSISEEDIAAVSEVLRSDYLTCGPKVEEFERAFAAAVGATHAVAVNSATAALHLAMRVADIKSGDRVVTSPNTFLASANAAVYVGATPDFSDIDALSYNLDPDRLEEHWQADTKAVVAVDYAGQVCDMPAIAQVARARGAVVIEDASHGVGSAFVHEGRSWKLGGHPWADLTVFSFHPVKTMTTGEGGMLLTENEEWAARARRLRSHGIERDPAGFVTSDVCALTSEKGPWYHEMSELGYNYRLTDMQCALGLSQLSRLEKFVARRREIVSSYNAAFGDLPWLTTPAVKNPLNRDEIGWHLYTAQIDFGTIGKTRTEVMAELKQKGIGTQVLYIPVHLQPFYRRNFGYRAGKCPQAEAYYTRCLSLPLYPAMSNSDVGAVVESVCGLG
jgi:UDP-4-amino-4,6-dideoxy-N-acetyl-beta-L-altrosamine transaminase